MRDAYGGVFTMNLLIVFIFIYVAITAVSLNYAKAFRAKNAVIDFIEQQEISDLTELFKVSNSTKRDKLDAKLSELSYHVTCDQIKKEDSSLVQNINSTGEFCYHGVVFKVKTNKNSDGTESESKVVDGTQSAIIYYDIKTYATWNLGALNKLLALGGQQENSKKTLDGLWAIKGEAKVVVKN